MSLCFVFDIDFFDKIDIEYDITCMISNYNVNKNILRFNPWLCIQYVCIHYFIIYKLCNQFKLYISNLKYKGHNFDKNTIQYKNNYLNKILKWQ